MSHSKKFLFGKRVLENMELPPDGKYSVYYDTRLPGLGIRVSSKGRKSFFVLGKHHGKTTRVSIGPFPSVTVEQARNSAKDIHHELHNGVHRKAEERKLSGEMTLQDLWDLYREDHLVAHGKRLKNPEYMWRLYLKPWRRKRLSDVTTLMVRKLHAEIGAAGKRQSANRVVGFLQAMYNKAQQWELYKGGNPASRIEKFYERTRERALAQDEAQAFFTALQSEPNTDFRDFVLCCAWTGARSGNVKSMRWEDLDLRRGVWRIPRTKNGNTVVVALPESLIGLLHSRTTNSPWVFPANSKSGHIEEPKKAWCKLMIRAGIKGLRVHDLRHTVATWTGDLNTSAPVIQSQLGHRSASMTARYTHIGVAAKKNAMDTMVSAMLTSANVTLDTLMGTQDSSC